METRLADFVRSTPDAREAEEILGRCVHCGFCNATCPTYELLGDELDGPRGRIYLIKEMLEGNAVTRTTREHLDRCLTCRSCETTCPSGVQFGRLADIGRRQVEARAPRPLHERLLRGLLVRFLLTPRLFASAVRVGRLLRWRALMSPSLPRIAPAPPLTAPVSKVLLLAGCVQPALLPQVNAAATRVLGALGIEARVARGARCCGAIRAHLTMHEGALQDMRRNIDAWWPHIEQGVTALAMTASGCGVTVKEYAHHLRDDPRYRLKAERVSAMTRDLSEILQPLRAPLAKRLNPTARLLVAFHSPCSLQHGQQLRGTIESVLDAAGIEARAPAEGHLCCGSAGTYSLLQPALSRELRDRKLTALRDTHAAVIVSANVGCICHLQAGTTVPVRHWIELIAERLNERYSED